MSSNTVRCLFSTISHRPVLEAFHRKILRINGDAEKTYDFRELQSAEELASHVESGLAEHEKRRATMTRDTADETAQLLAERSKGFDKQNEEREARMADFKKRFNSISSWRRFIQICRLGFTPSAAVKVVGLLFFLTQAIFTTNVYIYHTKVMYDALLGRDKNLLFKTIAQMAGMAIAKAFFFDCCGNWLQKTLALELNQNIVHSLSDKVMINSNYYRVKNIDGRVTDVDVRIADDVSTFSESITDLWLGQQGFVNAVARLVVFSYRFQGLIRWQQTRFLYLYLALSAVAIRWLMPDYKTLTADTASLEGKFKKLHNNVRVASESIGFFGGGLREKKVLAARFDGLMDKQREKSRMDRWMGAWKGVLLHVGPDRIQLWMQFQMVANEYSDEAVALDEGKSLASDVKS